MRPCHALADTHLARVRPAILGRRLKCGTRVRPTIRRLHGAAAAARREGDRFMRALRRTDPNR